MQYKLVNVIGCAYPKGARKIMVDGKEIGVVMKTSPRLWKAESAICELTAYGPTLALAVENLISSTMKGNKGTLH
jgi:hypothetical protein